MFWCKCNSLKFNKILHQFIFYVCYILSCLRLNVGMQEYRVVKVMKKINTKVKLQFSMQIDVYCILLFFFYEKVVILLAF